MKTTCLIVALFGAFGAARAAKAEHPIEKVVVMLQGLSAKAEAEGKEEALAYEKYEYFVKNSVKELSGAIAQEKSDIEELTDLIDSKEKAKEVLTGQIADLTQELSDLDVEMKGAKNNRQDAEDIYDDKSAALKLTIEGCQQCLTLLSTSKDATDTGLLQQKVSALVPLLAAKASKQQLALLQEFGRPDQLASGDRTSHEKGYAFKSGSVVELLKGLEAKFTEELLETNKAETNSVNAFELANAARQDLIDAATASKEAKTKELGEVEGDLEEAKGTKADTEADLQADSDTLKETQKGANMKASEWAERSKTRSNELEAIKVAIGILAKVSGVRTEAPENPVPPPSPIAEVFVQLKAASNDPKMKAVELIRSAAKVAHSRALEQLAAQVAAHLTGPFDEVNNMVEKMIFRLMDEQKNEDEHKHWCDQELEKSNTSLVDKEEKYEELATKISNGESKSVELVEAISDASKMAADITSHMAEATEIRKVGKQENTLAIKDSEDAQTAVSNAIAVLEAHYKDSGAIAKESWEFIQAPVELPDSPSTWDSGYTGVADPKAQPGGIVAVLEKVNEDFAEMEAQTRAQEQSDQDAYDEEMKECGIEKARRSKEAEMKTQEQKRVDTKVESQKKTQKGVSKEIDAVKQYLTDLEPACVSGDSSYEDRKAARDKEIEALKQAKGILLKAFDKADDSTTAAPAGFLQRK